MFQRLLLLPLLSPLLAVLLVAAINPRPAVRLRLLVWHTPSLPIGVWLAAGAAAGAALSAAGTALALQQPSGSGQRQVRRGAWRGTEPWADDERWGRGPAEPARARRVSAPPADPDAVSRGSWPPSGPDVQTPQRQAGEPPPTVAVPFRVIRRGSEHATRTSASAAPAVEAPPRASTSATASAGGDGWGEPIRDAW